MKHISKGMIMALSGLIFLLTAIPIKAQQNTIGVPTANPNAALLATWTTTASTSAKALTVTPAASITMGPNANTPNPVSGTHNIYGYNWVNAAQLTGDTCYLQVFDQQAASVTVGTTAPKVIIPIAFAGSSSTLTTPYVSPYPLFTITSQLTVAATSTSTGSSACLGTSQTAQGYFLYR